MSSTRKLWISLAVLLVSSFGVLLWMGASIHQNAPPMPERVVDDSGRVIYTRADIEKGRRSGNRWAACSSARSGDTAAMSRPTGARTGCIAKRQPYSTSGRDAKRRASALTPCRRSSRPRCAAGWSRAYARIPMIPPRDTYARRRPRRCRRARRSALRKSVRKRSRNGPLREAYAMKNDTVPDPEHRRALTALFLVDRVGRHDRAPGSRITYTNNWPSEPLIGNRPPASTYLWSAFSVLFLIAGIALLGWHHAVTHGRTEETAALPSTDPLALVRITPSMSATAKYFWVVLALFLVQILLGAITAHYSVEGQNLYGVPLSDILPYSLTRTWHTQLAVLWIATAWLGTGLYIGPAISGHEPKYQRLGVNLLWVCLLIIVVGAFSGQWLAVMQKLGLDRNFWFGHQGWEYADIGRFWQWFLFIGLMLWLVLVGRALWPALTRGGEGKSIVGLLFLSTVAIGLFYGAGLLWNEHTSLSMVEYWRWWLVHLWVEGFFEVFATAVIAFLFTRLGLLAVRTATVAVLFATIVFMAGGVLGTLHHLYFAGTPAPVLALGASFSALEVVPLAYIGFEAYRTYKLGHATPWMSRYRWPILFFVAVAFWNLVGAGLFGFLINPPLSLYYMQGLNLTPLHGHTALFGVYGMLGIGLVLFCLRGLKPGIVWNERLLRTCFWTLNIGLALMALLTLLPIGTIQLLAAIDHGYWFARSAEFMHQPLIELLVWMRVPGDTIFSVGAVSSPGS